MMKHGECRMLVINSSLYERKVGYEVFRVEEYGGYMVLSLL